MTFVYGLIGIGLGLLLVLKTDAIMQFTGGMDWAEEHLRMFGGSRLFIKILGVLAIFISILAMTGLLGGCARAVLSPLTGGTVGQ